MAAWITKIITAIFGNDIVQTIIKVVLGSIAVDTIGILFKALKGTPAQQAATGLTVSDTDFTAIVADMVANGDISEQAATSLQAVYDYLKGESTTTKTIATIAVLLNYFSMAAKTGTGVLKQTYDKRNRPNPPPIDTVVNSLHFGDKIPASTIDILQRNGISDADISNIQQALRTPLDSASVLQLLFNGILSSNEAVTHLQYSGLSEADANLYLQSSPNAPLIDVIIGLLTGQVLDDTVAATLGLDTPIPDSIHSWLKSNGVPDSFAPLFWRAHYSLPPIDLAYSAYNRGLISISDLHNYYSAINMTPNLTPVLDSLSSTPISMLQAAEALQNGIIVESDFLAIAKENGFSDHASGILLLVAQSTLNSNVTSGTIQGIQYAVSDGFMSDSTAQEMFKSLGMTAEQAAMQVSLAHYNAQYQAATKALSAIESSFKARTIDGNQATTQMLALGLLASKAQSYLTLWSQEATAATKVPTPTQIADMVKTIKLPIDVAIQYLGQNGYDPTTAARLAALYLAQSGG